MFKLSTKNTYVKFVSPLCVLISLTAFTFRTIFRYKKLYKIGMLKYAEARILLNYVTVHCSPGHMNLKPSDTFLKLALAIYPLQ